MNFRLSIAALACAVLMPLSGIAQSKTPASDPVKTEPQSTSTVTKTTSTTYTKVTTKTSKPTKGYVVSLLTLKRVTAQEASAMTNKSALGFLVGTKIYYVVKADGSSVGDDLARLADASVGVIGKKVSRGGMTVLLADIVDTMK
jgi:hypothetical protein